ncbi:R-spondin-4 [Galemys pyrenaicus]|uniref:R-spondin-4 n=1 Tax=Galemys pyrenaicus TaxID=202257 RepID=A0A8J6DYK7_GALPY|nr:R-spondin-4 [Galemys pyrenaicus]
MVWLAVGTGLGGNCTGCVICSEENGCSTCQQRLFLFIRREGIRQYGKCVHDCPSGYFGVRGQEVNRCKKCGATCESCFSQDFCIQCKRRFYLYKGKCLPTCPPGTAAQPNTRECQEECELGPWGSWSPCTHKRKTCGSAWGLETRVREAGRAGREEAATCQVLSESRKCPMQRPCPGGEHRWARGLQWVTSSPPLPTPIRDIEFPCAVLTTSSPHKSLLAHRGEKARAPGKAVLREGARRTGPGSGEDATRPLKLSSQRLASASHACTWAAIPTVITNAPALTPWGQCPVAMTTSQQAHRAAGLSQHGEVTVGPQAPSPASLQLCAPTRNALPGRPRIT